MVRYDFWFQLWLSSSSLCIRPYARCARSGRMLSIPVASLHSATRMFAVFAHVPSGGASGPGLILGGRPTATLARATADIRAVHASAPPGLRPTGGSAAVWPGTTIGILFLIKILVIDFLDDNGTLRLNSDTIFNHKRS